MKKKIVIIGAGSAMFTRGLVTDLIKFKPGGHDWTIGLCDIDAVVLDDVTALVKKMISFHNDDIEVVASTDRKELLPEADYVVTTIGVGGRRAWEQDVYIPRKYGIFQPVGDTAMPGGISRAMRMVPAMIEIAADIAKWAPQAQFFNYANPMAVICRALAKVNAFPVTGLCIGTPDSEWSVADYMGYSRKNVTTLAAGINHCTFIYDYRHNGTSVIEDIREKAVSDFGPDLNNILLENRSDDIWNGRSLKDPFAWNFFIKYGAWPAPGDRHITEFFAEHTGEKAYFGKTLGVETFSFERTIAGGDRIHQELTALARSDQPLTSDFFGESHGEHEQLTSIIDSIERDNRTMYYVNRPNAGAVANLPDWAVIEQPAVAAAYGMAPITQNHFPDHLASFTGRFLANIELTVDAALQGNRSLLEEAIVSGGYITDKAAVRKMTEELLQAHKQYLPQF